MSYRGVIISRMKQVELWSWTLRSETTGQVRRSRWKMTEDEAKARDPMAQRVEGTREVRQVAETPEEMPAHSTSFAKPTFGEDNGHENIPDSVSARDRRVIAIRVLRGPESIAELLLRCKGSDPAAASARVELACALLMVKMDAPADLQMTDPGLYKRLRDRITEIRMGGWLPVT